MLGAIIGDIVGSVYEFDNIKKKNFELFSQNSFFTDDSAMTVAISNALVACKYNYGNLSNIAISKMQNTFERYPELSYGQKFKFWLMAKEPMPYDSFGNGAAMRVSAVPYFAKDLDQVIELSKKVTAVSHSHPEGIKGAEATAVAIWLALHKKSKDEIKKHIEEFYYKLDFNYEDLKENYKYDETCQGTVPQAIYCFLISTDFEDALRTAVSIGGDSDTLCASTGAIAEAFYGIPEEIRKTAKKYMDRYISKSYKAFIKKSNYKAYFND